jgi:hypothetical protein
VTVGVRQCPYSAVPGEDCCQLVRIERKLDVRRRASNVLAALKISFSALQGDSEVIKSSPNFGEQAI